MLFMFEGRLDVNVNRNELLGTAARVDWATAVDLLLEAGADLDESGVFQVATGEGHEGLIERMMKFGIKCNFVPSALAAAAGRQQRQMIGHRRVLIMTFRFQTGRE